MMKMQIPTMAPRTTCEPSRVVASNSAMGTFGMSAFGHRGTAFGAAFGTTAAFSATTQGTGVGISPLTQAITGALSVATDGGVRPKATNGLVAYTAHSGTPAWRPPLS
jgi:hypothetical protein